MHDYTTIIGVIELRLNKISYDNVHDIELEEAESH